MAMLISKNPALPTRSLLAEQADWLAPARGRLFRQIGIAHRTVVLDLGAGYGAVTAELARRSSGRVIALDLSHSSLHEIQAWNNNPIFPINGDGRSLPFPNNSFDLIFCQCSLMWIAPLELILSEIYRTLQPGGVLVALEPDYGGLIEHPPQLATRHLWLAALSRAGADPLTGRKLAALLPDANMAIRINLLDQLQPPSNQRFAFLHDLPLNPEQGKELAKIEEQAGSIPTDQQVAHLPFFLITAEKDKQ
jgi:SAM-dependent methyltransferase